MSDRTQSAEPQLAHFGKYLLDQEIARGGMSRVYRARLRGPGGFEKKLVVKQILPELARDPSFIELFVKEANTLVQMSHPNLVPVYELGVVDGVYFLAMEWVEGATIAELLRDGPLPAELVAHVGEQIAQALRYAHERFQIVHRDVTPRNVIIDGAGQARLLDFGIAAPAEHTGKGEIFGSPGYMAPEQTRGDPLGPESDVFGLGAVLYEAASGRPAFPRNEGASVVAAVSVREAPRLADLDPALGDLIARMLSPERKARPQLAAEVGSALRAWLATHHPQGVEQELAERAARAHAAREAAPATAHPGQAGGTSSGRVEVRSIATSPVLADLLKQATERIDRVSPRPAAPDAPGEAPQPPDPELLSTVRRFKRDIAVITVALIVAVWSGLRATAERDGRPADSDETTVSGITSAPPSAAMPGAALPHVAGSAPSSVVAPQPTLPSPALTAVALQPAADAQPNHAANHDASKLAYVTVSAAPWAEVRIDGHALGTTPRRRLPVRAGKHALSLSCPPLGKDARVALDLHEGQAVQVIVDLHESPPKISVH
jgi:serine/threonine-protein kinase